MPSNYPSGFDDLPDPGVTLAGPPAHSTIDNAQNDAIEKLQQVLGLNPQSAYSTVGARLAALGVFTSWTPAVYQPSGAAIAATVYRGSYTQIGKWCTTEMHVGISGTGTAGQLIEMSLPQPASGIGGQVLNGKAWLYDDSGNLFYYPAAIILASPTRIRFASATLINNGGVLGSSDFTQAISTGDVLSVAVTYQVA